MTFDELMGKVRTIAEKTDVSKTDPMVVQVNIVGKGEGVFSVEVKDHKTFVEATPREDRDCAFQMSMDDFNRLLEGKLNPVMAYMFGRLKVEGDFGTAMEFSRVLNLMK